MNALQLQLISNKEFVFTTILLKRHKLTGCLKKNKKNPKTLDLKARIRLTSSSLRNVPKFINWETSWQTESETARHRLSAPPLPDKSGWIWREAADFRSQGGLGVGWLLKEQILPESFRLFQIRRSGTQCRDSFSLSCGLKCIKLKCECWAVLHNSRKIHSRPGQPLAFFGRMLQTHQLLSLTESWLYCYTHGNDRKPQQSASS